MKRGRLEHPEEAASRVERARTGLAGYFNQLIGARRGHQGDDLLGALIAAEEEGDRLSSQELLVQSIGLLIAGDDGYASARGFGRTASPGTFGHNGAGGQLAWADPATGLSLGYTTNGFDRHEVRQPKRGAAIGALAALCTTPT